jgi:hypothetical protein
MLPKRKEEEEEENKEKEENEEEEEEKKKKMVMMVERVYCALRTGSFNKTDYVSSLKVKTVLSTHSLTLRVVA